MGYRRYDRLAMRVLLIEDDRKAAKLLAKGLQEEGFVVGGVPCAPVQVAQGHCSRR